MEHTEFRDQYARAREAQADYWAEEIIEISDDGANDTYTTDDDGPPRVNQDVIARSRLRVDTRKWLMARMAPKKYGDRVTQELVGKDGGPIQTEKVKTAARDKLSNLLTGQAARERAGEDKGRVH